MSMIGCHSCQSLNPPRKKRKVFFSMIPSPPLKLFSSFLPLSFAQAVEGSLSIFIVWLFTAPLESLLHARRDRPQVAVDLGRRLSENQADDRLASHVDVLVCAENVDLAVGQYDTGLAGVFDGDWISLVSVNKGASLSGLGVVSIHFVLPSLPAMRPMARPWASLPITCLTSRISKVSTG